MLNTKFFITAAKPLAALAAAFDSGKLDVHATTDMVPADIELLSGRGGCRLLTLEQAYAAKDAIESENEDTLRAALMPLVDVARAFHSNSLDGEARKFWGETYENMFSNDPKSIVLVENTDDDSLLTLAQALFAHLTVIGREESEAEIIDLALKGGIAPEELAVHFPDAGVAAETETQAEAEAEVVEGEVLEAETAEVAEVENLTVAEVEAELDADVAAEVEAEIEAAAEAEGEEEATEVAEVTYPVGTEDARVRIYAADEFGAEFPMKGQSWTDEQKAQLIDLFKSGETMAVMVEELGRSPVSLIGQLAREGLVVEDHPYAAQFAENARQRAEARAAKAAEAAAAPKAEEAPKAEATAKADKPAKRFPNTGAKWSEEDRAKLVELAAAETPMDELVATFGRSPKALVMQLGDKAAAYEAVAA